MQKCKRWWNATEWITSEKDWPTTEQIYDLHPPILVQHANIARQETPVLSMFNDHRFNKSLRTLAYLMRWKANKTGRRKYYEETVTAAELAETKTAAILVMQKNTFPEELRTLTNKGVVKQGKCKKLRLVLNQKGVIRCVSRVQFTYKYRILE